MKDQVNPNWIQKSQLKPKHLESTGAEQDLEKKVLWIDKIKLDAKFLAELRIDS